MKDVDECFLSKLKTFDGVVLSDDASSSGLCSNVNFYIDNKENFADFLKHLKRDGYEFSKRNSRCLEGSVQTEINALDVKIPYFDHPFVKVQTSYYECSHGAKYFKSKNDNVQHQDHPVCKKKKRFRIQDTKKMNCPVVMKVTRIVYFPKVELKKDVSSFKRKKTKMMNEVRRVLQLSGDKNGELEGKERYYCTFSLPSNHNHPIMTAYLNQKLDPSIQEEIKKLVENGITNTYFVKAALKKFVSEMPNGNSIPRMSKAFYPSIKIISNYIAKFTLENRVSNIDQVALQSKVNKWEKNKSCSIFYRPHDTENDFLLCYQTTWQKQLLKTFGGITLLDATYKTVKYALPMFCIAVKTNVNYCIVGMFITLSESSEKIKEALEIFKSWNPDWNPEYFVVDYSEAEINAIKSAFGCYIYLCDFHREQSWGRWTKKRDNLDYASDEDEIMAIFRAFANCKSKSEFEEKIEDLKSNDVFIRNPKALRYFENTWLPVKEMWIRCFFPDEFVFKISTNNGIESQFKMLKYGYLKVRNVNTLSELMTLMIEEVFYDLLNKYTQKNSSLYHGYKLYNKEIPHFLQNRPKPFIKHVCKRYDTAEEYSYDSILFEGGKLKVRSKTNPLTLYEVDFTKPSCNCEDFWRYRLPCVHFCAAFLYLPHLLSFEDLPETYRNSPYITINKDFNLFENQPQCDWNAEAHSNYQSIECCTNTAELGSDNMTKNTNVFVEEVSSVNVNEKNQAQDDVENKKKEKKIRNIREICKMLIDKTYNMSYEHDKVQVIETLLQEVDVKMNELQSFEFLPLRSIENKKRGPGSQLRDLPKRKRLKKTKAAGENDASAIAMNLVMEEATPVLIESTLIDNILV
ncbi:uncharacterized protein LOC135842756 [Planococcus citri]|uniref:uncharacterized protein LOC135842756 n=1 Tax=Planococcus citri TaxID=170843 RepID=UPI0031F72C0D